MLVSYLLETGIDHRLAAVLNALKGGKPPGSGRIGVIGALVFFFLPRLSQIYFTLPGQPGSALRH